MTPSPPLSVLVVEDDPTVRRSLGRVLVVAGFTVHSADGADSAFTALHNEEIDVVLSDHHLGGMDGVQLLELCRRSFPNVARILVTAANDFDVAARAVNEAEINALLRKPWTPPELTAALSKAVRAAPAARAASGARKAITIPQFTARLPHTAEAPTVTWDEVDGPESTRILELTRAASREAESLARLFGVALSR